MKARVNLPLNIRTGTPEVLPHNNPGDKYYNTGDVIDIAEAVIGEKYKDSNVWYRLVEGGFVWSGGVDSFGFALFASDTQSAPENIDPSQLDWSITNFGIDKIWSRFKTGGENSRIAILDSGFAFQHPLANSKNISGWNYVNNSADFSDVLGHGTAVASIINSNNKKLIAVAPNASCFIAKVKSGASSIQFFIDTLFTLSKCATVDVISISYDFDSNDNDFKVFEEPFKKAIEANSNKIIVSSSGNYTGRINAFPAKFTNVIAVGSIDENKNMAPDSNPFEKLDVCAPGVDVELLNINNPDEFTKDSGTSFATPYVAGIAALLISYARKTQPLIPIEHWNITQVIKNSTTLADPNFPLNKLIDPLKCFDTLINKMNQI